MRLYGSVNITAVQNNDNQISGSVNMGIPLISGSDIAGESVLRGVISNVIIKVDIIPLEIKQALEQSGVKFL
jgi:hypothetical protein